MCILLHNLTRNSLNALNFITTVLCNDIQSHYLLIRDFCERIAHSLMIKKKVCVACKGGVKWASVKGVFCGRSQKSGTCVSHYPSGPGGEIQLR